MKKYSFLLLLALVFATLATPAEAATTTKSPFDFHDRGFSRTWQNLDKPVKDTPNLGRGYTWGPVVSGSNDILTEPYNGVLRKVQYFDKARMEVSNPDAKISDPYYVTTGLLVKELVTGNRQDGDNTFISVVPSNIQVAGDPNFAGGNEIAPTYASFRKVVTFEGNENGQPENPKGLISQKIDRAGNVQPLQPLEPRLTTAYDPITGHNIADVFVEFGKQNGLIWNGKANIAGALFGNNPTYVLGRPVTEPYWTRAVCAGVEKDVLVQLFERRVLTYTPTNPAAFRVEMGNVGQHYFQWRYLQNRAAPRPTLAVLPGTQSKLTFSGQGTVFDRTFYSQALKRQMPYRLYLPPDYAATTRNYAVLYMLHGRFGSYTQWSDLGLLRTADDLIGKRIIQPFIIVMPEGEMGYWMNQADGGPRWSDYVAIDLVSQIDGNFRTVTTRNARAIGGMSMGGHGAYQIAFNYPELFGIIGGHSAALRTKAEAFDFFGDDEYYATVDPVSLLPNVDVSRYKMWLDIGQQDEAWVTRTTLFHQLLLEAGANVTWNLWEGGHTSEYWAAHSKDYLQFYARAFS